MPLRRRQKMWIRSSRDCLALIAGCSWGLSNRARNSSLLVDCLAYGSDTLHVMNEHVGGWTYTYIYIYLVYIYLFTYTFCSMVGWCSRCCRLRSRRYVLCCTGRGWCILLSFHINIPYVQIFVHKVLYYCMRVFVPSNLIAFPCPPSRSKMMIYQLRPSSGFSQ